MKTVAIYRLLYGSDFIGESLASIYDHCERILCFVGHDAFGGGRIINYFGHDVYLPHDIDGVRSAIEAWKKQHDATGKVIVIENRFATLLKGQVQRMVNDEVIPRYPDTTHVLFVEADEVWHDGAIRNLMSLAGKSDADEFMVNENLLFWRSPRFVSTRTNPYAVLRALKGRRQIGLTGHALASASVGEQMQRCADPAIRVHNFGYAASERTIFWKHMTALSFSRDQGLDSPPREEWFEDVWRAWNWETNRREDLCPSIGYERAFPAAKTYPFAELPALMQKRVRENPLAEWARAEIAQEAEAPR